MSPSSPNPDSLARESQAAIDRKDWAAADSLLRRRLAASPDDPSALHDLGMVAYRRGALPEAEHLLLRAVKLGAGTPSLLLLGRIFAAARRDTEALRAYKMVLKADPAHFEALMAVGDLRNRNGDRAGAREAFRQATAARPEDVDATLKYAEALWGETPEASVAMTMAALSRAGGDLHARARALQAALWQVEFVERIRRGQMPYHGANIDELFFTYAAPYLKDFEATCAGLAADPNDLSAKVALGLARFCRGDRHGAEALLQAAGPAIDGSTLDAARFSPEFHAALRAMPETELTGALPPVATVRPPVQDAAGVLYLSCDPVYAANFGLPLLCSLHKVSPGTPVHLHLIDPAAEDVARLIAFCERLAPLRFALTTEAPGLKNLPKQEARIYFHAVRLIRFHQALALYDGPLWMTDVDAIVHAPLVELFSRLGSNDIALRIRPGRLEPQSQFSACAIGAAPTGRARAYIRQVAAYIAYFHRRDALRWGIDQLALYSVFADLQDRDAAPALSLLGNTDIVLDSHAGGTLWMTAGAQKFSVLEREAQGAAPPEAEYAKAFSAYRAEARTLAAAVGWEI